MRAKLQSLKSVGMVSENMVEIEKTNYFGETGKVKSDIVRPDGRGEKILETHNDPSNRRETDWRYLYW